MIYEVGIGAVISGIAVIGTCVYAPENGLAIGATCAGFAVADAAFALAKIEAGNALAGIFGARCIKYPAENSSGEYGTKGNMLQ
jgi:hypothetical protein